MIIKNTHKEDVSVEISQDTITIDGEQASIKVDEAENLITLNTISNRVELSTTLFFALKYQQHGSIPMKESHIGMVEALYIEKKQHGVEIKQNLMHCKNIIAISPSQLCAWREDDGTECKKTAYFATFTCDPQTAGARLIVAPVCPEHEHNFYRQIGARHPYSIPMGTRYPIRDEG
jgi:hypothetical protein